MQRIAGFLLRPSRAALTTTSQARKRIALGVLVMTLSIFASACERLQTHDADSQTAYDGTSATTGESYTIGSPPQEVAPGAYSGDKIATAHYDGSDSPEGAGNSQASGKFTVDAGPGYEGYFGAALYFPPGTLSGTTANPAKQKGRVDVIRWKNTSGQDAGGIRIDADHTARLFWKATSQSEQSIGGAFRFREGCWNWVFVHQKLKTTTQAGTNDVYLNGDRVVNNVSAQNITTGGRVDEIRYGLPAISSAQAGQALDVYVDDAYVGATNSDSNVPPRPNACEPGMGARPYWKMEDEQLNDRMGVGVNLATGNLLLSAADIKIAGTKLDLTLSRSYNSQNFETTKLGAGWTLSGAADVSVRYGSQGQAIYRGSSGERVTFKKNGSNYDSPTGFTDLKLTKDPGGTSQLEFLSDRTKLNFHSDTAPLSGSLSSIVDKNGNRIDFIYDANGVLQTIKDTQDRIITATTGTGGRITQLSDPTGRTWVYDIDAADELEGYTDPEGNFTDYDYDGPQGRLSDIIDPNNNTTHIDYESAYPYRVTQLTRIPNNQQIDPIWGFDYSSDPDSNVCGRDDDPGAGNVPYGKTIVTDPRTNKTTYCWDRLGRVRKVKDAKGHDRKTKYDSDSNVTEFTQGTAISNSTYGSEGRLQEVKSPTDAKTSFTYGDSNHPHFPDTITNASQQGSGQFQDLDYANNNLTKIADSTGANRTDLDYYDKGQLKSVIPPRGQGQGSADVNPFATRYTYSGSQGGNLTKIDRPDPLGDETFTYDGLSRIKTRTDGANHVQTYDYDKLDRITRIGYKNSPTGAEVSFLRFYYDDNGNMTCRSESSYCGDAGATETNYTYDELNRLTVEDFPSTGVQDDNQYRYDDAGNLVNFRESDPYEQSSDYTYDEVNNLTRLVTPGSLQTMFSYDDRDNRTGTSFPNGVQIDQTFDKSNRITTIKAYKGTAPKYVDLQYFYKDPPAGISRPAACGAQPATDTDLLGCVNDVAAGTTVKYSYEANTDRLTEADMTAASPTDYKYYFDGNGNRTKQEVITSGGTTTTHYAYGYADQLCWAFSSPGSGCTPAPTGATTYTFTGSGNQTGFSGGCDMQYNTRDQNTVVNGCGNGNTTNAQYLGPSNVERVGLDGGVKLVNSALGLVKRTDPTEGSDGVFFRRDDDGKLVQAYRKDESSTSPFQTYYYGFDALGSVILLTDRNGAKMRTYRYDPYGNATVSYEATGAPADPFRFVSGYQGSGYLYHFGFRFYDPRTGRWTQQDPLSRPQDPRSQNHYMYVDGDPINGTDPSGLSLTGWREMSTDYFKKRPKKIATRTRTGARTGYKVGGTIGCVLGAAASGQGDDDEEYGYQHPGIGCITGGSIGAAAGASAGTVVGAISGLF